MLKILILVCPMAVNRLHCDRDTAIDIVQSMQVASPQQCGFMGQAMQAPTSLTPEPGKQYVKILCVRDQTLAFAKPWFGSAVAGPTRSLSAPRTTILAATTVVRAERFDAAHRQL